jgi:hypothetical protein
MLRHARLEHRFVQYIPDKLEPGIIYISMEFATAAHACCCGCGEQVITPFTPTDWSLTFDGETVSLWPSIGNWNFRCRSHYIIRRSRIFEAEAWDDQEVEDNRGRDKQRKQDFFNEKESKSNSPPAARTPPADESLGFWDRLGKTWGKWHR